MTLSEYKDVGAEICKSAITYLPFNNYKARLKAILDNINEHYLKLMSQNEPVPNLPDGSKGVLLEDLEGDSTLFKPDLTRISLELQQENSIKVDNSESDNDISSSETEENLQNIIMNQKYQAEPPRLFKGENLYFPTFCKIDQLFQTSKAERNSHSKHIQ